MNPQSILQKVNHILKTEGKNMPSHTSDINLLIKSLRNNADILSGLSTIKSERTGFFPKVKEFVLNKLSRVAISALEPALIKQQKFNTALVQILERSPKDGK